MGLLKTQCGMFRRFISFILWGGSICVLCFVLIKCAQLAAYNWWAAGFKSDPRAPRFQHLGDLYFVGALCALIGIGLVFLVYFRLRKRRNKRTVVNR